MKSLCCVASFLCKGLGYCFFHFPLLFEASGCILQTPAFSSQKEYKAGQRTSGTASHFIVGSQFLEAGVWLVLEASLDNLNSAQDFFSGGHSSKKLFKAIQMP